jgi:uncharacterized protein DUF6884
LPLNATVILISCSKTKRPYRCAAKDLYCSRLFSAHRAYAEAVSDRWFILSAKYGLLDPDEEIAPYEKTLNGAPVIEKRAWAARVSTELEQKIVSSDRIFITAGENYCRYLIPLLEARGHEVRRPLQGVSMGFQPRHLRELAKRAKLPSKDESAFGTRAPE